MGLGRGGGEDQQELDAGEGKKLMFLRGFLLVLSPNVANLVQTRDKNGFKTSSDKINVAIIKENILN